MTELRKITMDDMTIQAWDLDRPIPAENNHKKHTEESVAKLAGSMADIGQIQPIIVDKEGEIIAGHGRLMAAKKLGWDKVKVIQLPVDRATAIKARIADNMMSNQSIDQEKMLLELNELAGLGDDVDLSLLFNDDKHADMIGAVLDVDLDMDFDAISQDIAGDVETFSEGGEESMKAADTADTPLRKVFGFSNVSPGQARILKDFMAQVMVEQPGLEPVDALTSWVEEILA